MGSETKASDKVFLMGDFNAEPGCPAYNKIIEAGYQSALKTLNGKEPDVTFPTGL